ncbi:MAG: peptidylprolyl isomerase [Gammaproteobacteria bacterium]
MNRLLLCLVFAVVSAVAVAEEAPVGNPAVVLDTSLGSITLELFADAAPASTKNFLGYVERGFYDGTVFHRVIPGFMVQGGGFTDDMVRKPTRDPITNEADNGRVNQRGTLAMARTSDPHSATAQFFINVVDNDFLNHSGKTPRGWGYAVFGRVTAGMDVVDAIAAVQTGRANGMSDVPLEPVIIRKAQLLSASQ